MIGHQVQYSHTLAGTYRSTSVPQVIQAISTVAYSGDTYYKGALGVDELCTQPYLLNNISIYDMLGIQLKAYNPEQKSSLKSSSFLLEY